MKSITFDAFHRADCIGYFSALYWLTSERIKEAIVTGAFDDNSFVDNFDMAFAGKYIQAYSAYRHGQAIPTYSWQFAFQLAQRGDEYLILQHLIVELNAHILVDLGLTVAERCPLLAIEDFHDDYMRISDILAEVISEAEYRVSRNTGLIATLNNVFPTQPLTELGLRAYRKMAWDFALELARSPRDKWPNLIFQQEKAAIELGQSFLGSSEIGQLLIAIMGQAAGEDTVDVPGNIARLSGPRAEFILANIDDLKSLAFDLTAKGQYEEALIIDMELAEKCPADPLVHYNLACSYSLTNRLDDCLQALSRALSLGYEDFDHMLVDEDLYNIRGDLRFQQLIRLWISS